MLRLLARIALWIGLAVGVLFAVASGIVQVVGVSTFREDASGVEGKAHEVLKFFAETPEAIVYGVPLAMTLLALLGLAQIHTGDQDRKTIAELRDRLAPKIRLSFQPGEPCVSQTIVRVAAPIPTHSELQAVTEFKAKYLRVRIETEGDAAVDAKVFLTAMEKSTDGGVSFVAITVPHEITLADGVQVIPEVGRVADFMKATEADKFPTIQSVSGVPYTLMDVYREPAIYRHTFKGSAGGRTVSLKVDIAWNGNWQDITGTVAG